MGEVDSQIRISVDHWERGLLKLGRVGMEVLVKGIRRAKGATFGYSKGKAINVGPLRYNI